MIKTKTINAGPVGLKPKGEYVATDTYTLLDCVLYDHDSWMCKAVDGDGNPVNIKGQTPAAGSQYWQALTDGGKAAYVKGNEAERQGNIAEGQGNEAERQGRYAESQGEYAEAWNTHPPYIGDGTTGDLNYWYLYDITTSQYVRAAYAKGDDLDYSTMTAEEYQRLIDSIKADLVYASEQTCRDIVNELT